MWEQMTSFSVYDGDLHGRQLLPESPPENNAMEQNYTNQISISWMPLFE